MLFCYSYCINIAVSFMHWIMQRSMQTMESFGLNAERKQQELALDFDRCVVHLTCAKPKTNVGQCQIGDAAFLA